MSLELDLLKEVIFREKSVLVVLPKNPIAVVANRIEINISSEIYPPKNIESKTVSRPTCHKVLSYIFQR